MLELKGHSCLIHRRDDALRNGGPVYLACKHFLSLLTTKMADEKQAQALEYLEEHQIPEVFEQMTSQLVYYKPGRVYCFEPAGDY